MSGRARGAPFQFGPWGVREQREFCVGGVKIEQGIGPAYATSYESVVAWMVAGSKECMAWRAVELAE